MVRGKAAAARLASYFAELLPNTEIDGAERLVGLDAIQSRLEALANGLARECLAILPGGAQSVGSREASRPLDERALRRGVEMRTIYQDSVRNDPATLTSRAGSPNSVVRYARASSCRSAS
ncbi:hypothetical protein [Streptomyces sp. MBT27]|uniref:hypothetical protein n=1 Tax=Streptomyces sp. MBT27 TaxID=1488356 RepID=UPI001F0803A4|nr:hypothetical protein [Streptomyces sp. MBT27]